MSPRVLFEDEAAAEYRLAGIRILAIAHDRRKPGYWTNRLE